MNKGLHDLAFDLGIEAEWRAADGALHTCSDETLLATIAMLGVPIARPEDAGDLRMVLARERNARLTEPVVVAWDGAPPALPLRLPRTRADAAFAIHVETEDLERRHWSRGQCSVRVVPETADDDVVHLHVQLPRGLPTGRHRLTVEAGGALESATLLSAPTKLGNAGIDRAWGVFAPVYALHDRNQANTGTVHSLARLAGWAADHGGRVVGTLPMLATFVGHGNEPCDPSPYAPVSRRFWNETYVDLALVPEIGPDPVPPEPSPGRTVDLPKLAAVRRAVFERAVARIDEMPRRRAALHAWIARRPDALDYAQFRAEKEGSGELGLRLHVYVQWLMATQLDELAGALTAREQVLYLDMPIGAHRDGYDVAIEGDLFVRDASVGAPPDDFYEAGQNWGFPPVDPRAARRTGYAYLASCLDAQLRYAHALRVDHIMGWHRLWMIAPGASARDGAYVHYAAEEQWAVACIAAARRDATIIGENLGTVPPDTDRALDRHHALGMWVAEFEVPDDADADVRPPPAGELACIATHDLPTFATWWRDLADTPRTRLVETLRASGDLDQVVTPDTVLAAVLSWLGRSRAPIVLVQLEDLWLETESQNEPGTDGAESFRRRAAYGLDELETLPHVRAMLGRLEALRHRVRSTI